MKNVTEKRLCLILKKQPKSRQTIRQRQLSEVNMGLTMQEKKSLTMQVRSRYLKAGRKEKSAVLNEFVLTTGYNRKYAPRIFNRRETKDIILNAKDGTVKLKPVKKDRATAKARKSRPMTL
jgi:hypothetical protein